MYLSALFKSGLNKSGFLTKTIRIMKLTTVLLIAACLQVSAKGYSQKVTLKENNISLQKVFEEIRKQTGYQFFYADEVLVTAKNVTVNIKKGSIEKVLNFCFQNQQLTYTISENTIIVKRKVIVSEVVNALPPPPPTAIEIKGKITDGEGQPLEGATILVKGTNNGTKSDANGNFSIDAEPNSTLVISYVGFETTEVKIGNQANISVQLKPSIAIGEQIVVIGYGTQKKRDLTGSIAVISGDEVAKQPSTNPISSLQGRVAGLTIVNSGQAGASPTVRIRGVNSTNNADPLYVVDGILQTNIDYLNAADIQTIEVLKDPSSIAIYGLQGGNGVIIITTKRAKNGQTIISLQSNVSVQKVNDKIKVVDAAGFKKLYSAQLANINAAPFDFSNYTANTNWQDQVLRSALLFNNSLSVSNSTDKSTTYLNVGYSNQQGVLKYDQYEKYIARLNEEIRVNKNIRIGGDITGFHYKQNPPAGGVNEALWAAPIVPVKAGPGLYYTMPSFQRAQV
ncbi:MAG TPA: carboxypeptidase-like regulatory domain-containing protein, partial [Bacteroidia bacterium]